MKEMNGLMKRRGCKADEFLFRLLIKGLRKLGETDVADEVEKDFKVWFDGGIGASQYLLDEMANRR